MLQQRVSSIRTPSPLAYTLHCCTSTLYTAAHRLHFTLLQTIYTLHCCTPCTLYTVASSFIHSRWRRAVDLGRMSRDPTSNPPPKSNKSDLLAPKELVDKRFEIVKKIKGGGFGQVYEARDTAKNGTIVAVKVEDRKKTPVLGHEVAVLMKMRGTKHVAKIFWYGKAENRYNYIAMQLLGKNLADLRRQSPDKTKPRFSAGTAARLCTEWLDAIKEMHGYGFIHRDVKGSNFAIGCTPSTKRTIFLIDYGMARVHVNPATGAVVPERPRVSFRGTVRYASIAAHLRRDLGRKDDLVSMHYSIVEAFVGRLPWRTVRDKQAVLEMKQKADVETLCKEAPLEVLKMGKYLDTLKYADRPDYESLSAMFRALNIRLGTKPLDPYDWECDWKTFQFDQVSSE